MLLAATMVVTVVFVCGVVVSLHVALTGVGRHRRLRILVGIPPPSHHGKVKRDRH
jgi:hypothetical protein